MQPTAITYNGFNLNNANYVLSELDDSGSPERRLGLYNLARAPGGVITDNTFGTKQITGRGTIIGSSITDLENRIDAFHAAMSVTNQALDIGYGGATRRYICTAEMARVERPVRGVTWANFSFEFVSTEYARDTVTTNLVNNQGVNATGTNRPFTLGGSAPQQYPDVQVNVYTVDPANAGLLRTLSIVNPTTTEALNITRIWANGDVVLVANSTKNVTVNGNSIDWTGAFHTFAPEPSSLTFNNDFLGATNALATTVTYIKRYL